MDDPSIKTKIINDAKIIVPRIVKDKRPVKFGEVFAVPYSNVFLCALKQSGKTTCLTNIILNSAGKNTKIIIISNSVNNDAVIIDCIKKLRKRGNDIIELTDIVEDGINAIEEFIAEHKEKPQEEENEQQIAIPQVASNIVSQRRTIAEILNPVAKVEDMLKQSEIKQEIKPKKKSKIIPEYIIVLDDVGKSLRDKWVDQLVKTNRHYKAMVLISSQHLNDLMPSTLQQMGYVILFSKFSDEKLEELFRKLDLGIQFDQFYRIYKDATKKNFDFLFIDRPNNSFRKNFNEQYKI